ncbi:glycerophosphodiester phosphodiesterase family protein [Garciella nitratireducens]|uniref:glycerophosphodiester phosphodiesterase family protein n=1 Tax=Garciella nitratireducens TaxID=218205 RepID=UPI001BD1C331|nr:glycerophosphodiester phosphodiesterase family protein [Garciella nitratireducens]
MLIVSIVLVLILLYLLAIMPKMVNRPNMKEWERYYYAHRGFHQEKNIAPENSLAAFQLAVDYGYGIELDVQLTKDHIPVVFHDYSLKRVCGVDCKVKDLTYSELRRFHLYSSNEKIPHFQEVLDLVDGKVPLIIELKSEDPRDLLWSIAASYLDHYKGVYCIESFNPFGVLWFKRNRPKIIRGQLSSDFIRDKATGSKLKHILLKNMLLNFLTKPNFIAYNHKYRKAFSFSLCHWLYQIPCAAWTVRSQKELNKVRKSFDLFIFEHFSPEE